jgi:hypothetical protein
MPENEARPDLLSAVGALQRFAGAAGLTQRIASLEWALSGLGRDDAVQRVGREGVDDAMLIGALEVKRVAGEVNVAVHALGILLSLPHILEADERILGLSLGAGNTGRDYDLETDQQIAEFKFIAWRGGAESIRQNTVFVDIFRLAQADTDRRRVVYLTSLGHPLRFLRGRRALTSALSKNAAVAAQFKGAHGDRYQVVADYWKDLEHNVELVDLMPLVPALGGLTLVDDVPAARLGDD